VKILQFGAVALAAALAVAPAYAQQATTPAAVAQAQADATARTPAQPAAAPQQPLTRRQQAIAAGFVCGSAAYADSNCQTPTEARPK